MSLQLDEVLASLGIPDAREHFEPFWEESEACFPGETLSFLTLERFLYHREYTGLPRELDAMMDETARIVRKHPALTHFAWHCYQLLYKHISDYDGWRIRQWPDPIAPLGELTGVFYILVALNVVPETQAVHERLGIPEEITHHSLHRINEIVNRHRSLHGGRFGMSMGSLYWQRHYVEGILYGLGRMEYMIGSFHGGLQAYRHRETGEVIALSADGVRFRDDGYIDANPESEAAKAGWTARFTATDAGVTGCPISPAGRGLRCEVTLPLDTWQLALKPGDGVLDMHIPAGGGMTPERVQASMAQALEFFPRHFPDRPFVGFGCASWILNPQLAEFYSPDSNMVLWQRELYLFPYPCGDRSGLYFVFGKDDIDPDTAPRDTSLRRAILDRIASGGRLIVSGMFMLTEDFQRYGEQFYRSHFPPKGLAVCD